MKVYSWTFYHFPWKVHLWTFPISFRSPLVDFFPGNFSREILHMLVAFGCGRSDGTRCFLASILLAHKQLAALHPPRRTVPKMMTSEEELAELAKKCRCALAATDAFLSWGTEAAGVWPLGRTMESPGFTRSKLALLQRRSKVSFIGRILTMFYGYFCWSRCKNDEIDWRAGGGKKWKCLVRINWLEQTPSLVCDLRSSRPSKGSTAAPFSGLCGACAPQRLGWACFLRKNAGEKPFMVHLAFY